MNILILEDDYGIRRAYRDVLEYQQHQGNDLTFEFVASYDEFVAKFPEINPEIVWLDHRVLGEKNGGDVAHWVADNHPEVHIARLSSFREGNYPDKATYLGKTYNFTKLCEKSQEWVNTGTEPDWHEYNF